MKSAAEPLELHAGMNVPVAINCEPNIYYILNLDLLRLFQCVAATVSHFGMHGQPKEYWHCTCCNTLQLCRLFPPYLSKAKSFGVVSVNCLHD
jgi:hypothetical protein